MNEFLQAIDSFGIKSPELESEAAVEKTQQYCVLLWHKNLKLNLTRHTDWETFVSRDLVDTLQLSCLIEPGREVLDIGSGGGVPGLLLAIIRPDLEISLSESVGKRAKALAEFAETLSLNVQIYNERAENLLNDLRFDVTTARAVGSISKICTWLAGHWPNVGRLLATKGPNWINEEREAANSGLLDQVAIRLVSEYGPGGSDWKSVILELSAKRAPD